MADVPTILETATCEIPYPSIIGSTTLSRTCTVNITVFDSNHHSSPIDTLTIFVEVWKEFNFS